MQRTTKHPITYLLIACKFNLKMSLELKDDEAFKVYGNETGNVKHRG